MTTPSAAFTALIGRPGIAQGGRVDERDDDSSTGRTVQLRNRALHRVSLELPWQPVDVEGLGPD